MSDRVARGFATWKICHRRFATKKIRHTTNATKNLSVSVGQTFATVPMWKIRHTTVIGWGWGVGPGGLRELRSGGWGQVRGLGLGASQPDPNSPDPNSPDPNPPDLNPLNPDPNLSPLRGKSSTSALLQSFVRRLRSYSRSHSYVSLVVWQIFFVANLPCGESSSNHLMVISVIVTL